MSLPRSPYQLAHRVALAGLLFATVVAPSTAAQPIDEETVAAKQEILAPQQDVYPRSDTPVEIKLGQQTLSMRPLKRVQIPSGDEVVADRLIVGFSPFISAAEMATIHSAAARAGAGRARPVAHVGGKTYLVDVSGAVSLEAASRAYEFPGKVRFAQPDHIAHASEEPNDDLYNSEQWSMDKIQAPTAWNRTHGAPHRKIAILDSGINNVGDDAHPDLAGKVIVSKDFTDSSVGADDALGHGTHVAGIAAAVTNNSEGVAGAGYNSRLINAKVLDDNNDSSTWWIASGIYWAVDSGADVINISIGISIDCDTGLGDGIWGRGLIHMREAIDYAWSSNVLVVASAGNKGNKEQRVPAACPKVIAVANTNQTDNLNNSSTRGTWVDLAAPGTAVHSTAVEGAAMCGAPVDEEDDTPVYADCNGTSMAAPHVAGVAALVQASCLLDTDVQGVVNRLTSTADQIPGTGNSFQYGRLNAARAVCFPTPGNPRIGTVTPSSIQVRWDDTTPGESRFEIEHRPNGGNKTISPVGANAVSFTHTGVTPGTLYRYRVRACDNAGCSPWTNEITATAAFHQLTVQTTASKVTSTPGGITCGQGEIDCSQFYAPGTVVTLHAAPYLDEQAGIEYQLDKWEGDCSGLGCVVTMNGPRSVRAVYKIVDQPGQPCPDNSPNCQVP